jgi:glycerophosphoryl diester phosphodiesterase
MLRFITITALLFFSTNCYAEKSGFNALRIAHAGGGINGKTYTNSYEALDLNIKKGFTYFEIDFSFTRDNHLVCLHDWQRSFKRSFGFQAGEKPSIETFEFLSRNASEFTKCTLGGLSEWMDKNPTAIIVTDVKEDNLMALSMISKKIKNYQKRVIPQIYQPQNYNMVKKMGFNSIIWTLYRFNGSLQDVARWSSTFKGPFAITMPTSAAVTGLPGLLGRKGIPSYVHTINSDKETKILKEQYKVTEIYTDFLSPNKDEK